MIEEVSGHDGPTLTAKVSPEAKRSKDRKEDGMVDYGCSASSEGSCITTQEKTRR